MMKYISNIFSKIKIFKHYVLNHKITSSVVILILIFLAWYIFSISSENVKYEEIKVSRGSVTEVVSVTGNVKPLSDVDLSFERGGNISKIYVAVGDKVKAGQILASISNSDLIANLNQAQAGTKKALAQLQDVKNGTRIEEITLQETQVDKSALDLAQSKVVLMNTLKDSYTKADDAIRNEMYTLFIDPVKYNAKLIFSTESNLREDIEEGKNKIDDDLYKWYKNLAELNNNSDLDSYYNEAKTTLAYIKILLDKCAEAVNSLVPQTGYLTQTQIDTWKYNISSARSNNDANISNLNSSYNSYKAAIISLDISKNQLTLKKAGNTSDAIMSAEASYEAAQASEMSARAELDKTIIKTPIDGLVTNIDIKLGENVPSGKNIISVISYGEYEIETFVPEADIAKIKIGNIATTTLDSYGNNVFFNTSVIKIDPAATIIEGVPTYKTTLKFTDQDERVKSGMTANLDILSNKKDNAIILPSRAISTNADGTRFVTILDLNDKSDLMTKNIITGLRGSDGNVEIISGINEGDTVVIPAI